MTPIIRSLVLVARRDRLFAAILAAVLAIGLGASFVGDQSIVEGRDYVLSFAAYGARLAVVLGLVMFVVLHIRRTIDSRDMLVLLSRPVHRDQVVLAHWLGFTLVALPLVLATMAVIAVMAPADAIGLLLWGAGLWLEAGLMIAVALFFALGLNAAVPAILATAAFYLLSRGIGVLLAIVQSDFRSPDSAFGRGAEDLALVFGHILPRLDLTAQSQWLSEGIAAAPPLWLGGQVAVYTALMVGAAIFDFRNKRF